MDRRESSESHTEEEEEEEEEFVTEGETTIFCVKKKKKRIFNQHTKRVWVFWLQTTELCANKKHIVKAIFEIVKAIFVLQNNA